MHHELRRLPHPGSGVRIGASVVAESARVAAAYEALLPERIDPLVIADDAAELSGART